MIVYYRFSIGGWSSAGPLGWAESPAGMSAPWAGGEMGLGIRLRIEMHAALSAGGLASIPIIRMAPGYLSERMRFNGVNK